MGSPEPLTDEPPERLRSRLFLATQQLLKTASAAAVTTKGLAELLGISVEGFEKIFPTRREVFQTVLKQLWQRDVEALAQAFGSPGALSRRWKLCFAVPWTGPAVGKARFTTCFCL